ncbi:hypothetical protein [Ottowia thiooxydans]|uniref:Uncharacterized protein n=1 Tax=Ottowia thiooxydans TaxID=219182 RepID=A0ABV2QHA4_9BURK
MPVNEYQLQGAIAPTRPISPKNADSPGTAESGGREISVSVETQAPSQEGPSLAPLDWATWCKSLLPCTRPVKILDAESEKNFISTFSAVPSRSGMSAAELAREEMADIEEQILSQGKLLIQLLRSLHHSAKLEAELDADFRSIGIRSGIGYFEGSGSLASSNAAARRNALSWWDVGIGFQSTVGQVINSGTRVGAIIVATSVAGFFASYFVGGVAVHGVHLLGGGLALSQAYTTITQLPQTVNEEAFKHRVRTSMPVLGDRVRRLAELEGQEKRREPLSDIANVVAQENQKHIKQLTAQSEQIEAVLSERGPNDPSLELLLGSGGTGQKLLRAFRQAKAAFVSFFSPIVRSLSIIGGLLTGLPDVVRRACARRRADKQEQAFLVQYQSQVEVLARPLIPTVRECLIEHRDVANATRRARYHGSGRNRTAESVARQAQMGANLAYLIRNNPKPVYLEVQVNAHGAIPASLTLARALSWYLEIEAHKESTADDGGSITVSDPDGKLYGFLTSVPVAYSGTMAAVSDGRAPLGVLNIDDHGAGFPQGASCMQFEQELGDNDQLRLRMSFVEDPVAHVYAPLGNAGGIWKELESSTSPTEIGLQQPGEADFSETSNVALQRQQEALHLQIAMKKRLQKLTEAHIMGAENWSQLRFMRQGLAQA